jgi:hypothetical protein
MLFWLETCRVALAATVAIAQQRAPIVLLHHAAIFVKGGKQGGYFGR